MASLDCSGRGDAVAKPGVVVWWSGMNPTWIWMQVAIVVFVVIGMIVALVKLL